MTSRKTCIAAALALVLGACNSSDIGDGPKTVTPDGKILAMTQADSSIAELAVAALAEDLNIPIASIEVDSVRAVEWRDSSIGCPQPDQAYLQVITPGHKITLRVDKQLHVVHEANGRAAVCHKSKLAPGELPQVNLVWGLQAMAARKDLAATLGVEEGHILINGAEARTWSNSALGCEEPGVEYETGTFEGFELYLRHGSRNYSYHTDMERVFACPAITED